MAKPEWVKGIFRCYLHKFSSDPAKIKRNDKDEIIQDEEDQYYEHFRAVEHEYTGNGNCIMCKKHFHYDKLVAKVPPGERAPTVICNDCKTKIKEEQ